MVRQNFIEADIGRNKAAVMAERYGQAVDKRCDVFYIDKYLDTRSGIASRPDGDRNLFATVEDVIRPNTTMFGNDTVIVFNLVDNNIARRAVHSSAFNLADRNRIIVVDVGNDMYNGQGRLSMYGKESSFIPDRSSSYIPGFYSNEPEVWDANDDVSLYSCAEADVDIANQDQLLVANDFAATIAHNMLINIILSFLPNELALVQQEAKFICGNTTTATVSRSLPAPAIDFINQLPYLPLSIKDMDESYVNALLALKEEEIGDYSERPARMSKFCSNVAPLFQPFLDISRDINFDLFHQVYLLVYYYLVYKKSK